MLAVPGIVAAKVPMDVMATTGTPKPRPVILYLEDSTLLVQHR